MFEVASLKPSGPQSVRGSDGGPGTHDPQLYTFGRATLADFIMTAYDVNPFQISSKIPLDRHEFDLAARLQPATTKPQFRVMLRNLLADRFRLKLHADSKEFPAYVLVVAKTGPKLADLTSRSPTPYDNEFPGVALDRPDIRALYSNNGGFAQIYINAHQEPVSTLAGMLRVPDSEPVVDQTGLTDRYDFRLAYSLDLSNTDLPGASSTLPNLFNAIQQQLGLQLIHKKVAFDVLIIDQVDPVPTPN